MNSVGFLLWLARGALIITVAGWLLPAVCRRWRIESPRTRWWAVLVVFLTALSPWSWKLDIPWYPAERNEGNATTSAPSSIATQSAQPRANALEASPLSSPSVDANMAWVGGASETPNTSLLNYDLAASAEFPWPDFAAFLPASAVFLGPLWGLSLLSALGWAGLRYVRVVWRCRAATVDEQRLVENGARRSNRRFACSDRYRSACRRMPVRCWDCCLAVIRSWSRNRFGAVSRHPSVG